MSENVIADKSMAFAVRIVKLYQYLRKEKSEDVLSKQILRSGTSVGANVREAIEGYSRKEFAAKMGIALKEASETEYWLDLLYQTDYLAKEAYESVRRDCKEQIRLLTAIVKASRKSP